jgi:hypothetical protein
MAMKFKLSYAAQVLCAGAALGLAVAAPAGAEPWRRLPPRFDGLPPQEIVASVVSAGFQPLNRPVRRGPTYVVRAAGERGREMVVVVDARRGEVLSVRPSMAASRLPPSEALTMGPYERMGRGYAGPEALPPPGFYARRPPASVYDEDDDDDEAAFYGSRDVPPPRPPARSVARGEPRVIMASPPSGELPPPPGRLSPDAAPNRPAQAKPVTPKRSAAVTAPKSAPLPKPKPELPAAAPLTDPVPAPAEPAATPAEPAAPQARPAPAPAPAAGETPPPQGFE